MRRYLWTLIAAIGAAIVLQTVAQDASVGQTGGAANRIAIDPDDIGGIVTSSKGPEAGAWVIAETKDLPTKVRKIVVTDDQGRYLLPDLPKANYDVWVRGYGLVDSPKVRLAPGQTRALTAVLAPNARAAAQYYPASYWYSLIQIPPESDFPGTGPQGNGISPQMETQHHWINQIKTNCNVCHQLGNPATREIPKALGTFASSVDAWDRRLQVGQDGQSMTSFVTQMGRMRGLQMFAGWTDRIAAGQIPPAAPPRPQQRERNVVITMWEWGGPATFAHDELTTDKRNPTANANGMIYGFDWVNDGFLIVEPSEHTATELRIPVLDPKTPPGKPLSMPVPSPYWGDTLYWTGSAATNHAAMDSKGRVWMSSRFRVPEDQPSFCANHPSAALAPQPRNFRQIQYYDPNGRRFRQVNTCFDSHHVQFAADKDETLYANGPFSGAIGWVKTKVLDETGNESAAQGWCKPYFDLNRDGKIDKTNDREVGGTFYSVIPHPTDGSVWGAMPAPMPGRIVRINPANCAAEVYEPPFNNAGSGPIGYTPRGIDVDSNGVIWTALAGSGHLASFDRRKCKVLNGPEATTGRHCPEGWTLHPVPGPRFANVRGNIAVDFQYYNFVDRFNTLGLGENTPLANGTNSDSLLVLQRDGTWLVLRVPYPMGFFSRGMDGRIDDPKAGWKGRAIYANYGPNAVWHVEGGLGTKGSVMKFQIRPNPLAK